ncbi:DUF4334 domain-containing protein [Nocardia puris]|uniref:DUF4334 domain-containing protein n=1 Tax=Nocardia puris TaxID=208602 RepID=UPI0018957BD1|nr:DUF4334 domain-containing protein [Nocardia puris]MBF6209515.1 DUF4334 domain-containing protein [Nocardia puris]MBF6366087.1 DUF4334 domain-containing protein [Nocardia puris]MBF6458572.1 DUF4334 domain-containing protein [Nocardia puris]
MSTEGSPATARLESLRAGSTIDEASALFDSLPGVRVEDIVTGLWKGSELATGHPLDGVLTASGWYGKRFDSADFVHPLVFADDAGNLFPVDPRRVPLSLAGRIPLPAVQAGRKLLPVLRPALRTDRPTARLRNIGYRGIVSAAMVYDHLPIIDHFRRVDGATLLGVMDLRGLAEPYFFVLQQA